MKIVFFTPYEGKLTDIIIFLGHFLLLESKSKGHSLKKTQKQEKLRKMFGQTLAGNVEVLGKL